MSNPYKDGTYEPPPEHFWPHHEATLQYEPPPEHFLPPPPETSQD